MTRHLLSLCVLGAIVCLCGCTKKPNAVGFDIGNTTFGVQLAFQAVPPCSSVSPEITLKNVPQGTKRMDLKVLDIEFGTTLFQNEIGFKTTQQGLFIRGNDATLPQGSLEQYQSPCPRDKPGAYAVEVRAKDETGNELGVARTTQTVEPAQ